MSLEMEALNPLIGGLVPPKEEWLRRGGQCLYDAITTPEQEVSRLVLSMIVSLKPVNSLCIGLTTT